MYLAKVKEKEQRMELGHCGVAFITFEDYVVSIKAMSTNYVFRQAQNNLYFVSYL